MLCFLILAPGAFAQMVSYDDQLHLLAPTSSGETGLFTTIGGDMLKRGDWSFGIYLNDYDLDAADAPELAPLSARKSNPLGYDLYRLNLSLGYGLTDRWEVSASLPYDRIEGHGNDRAGYINGWPYVGSFHDSGIGDIRLSTKFALIDPNASPSRLAALLFFEPGTGDDKSGIGTGNSNFGVGLAYTHRIFNIDGEYRITGSRDRISSDPFSETFDVPNDVRLNAGLNVPLSFWSTTNWISEANGIFYNGGDRQPDNPIFLVTGLRHWFGESGWALNAGIRWNVAKWSNDHAHCEFTELDDCALGGLVGLTYAPFHLAAVAPPPPPVVAPPPPMEQPVTPPPPPVAPPHQPTELRTDEIHFEPASARLTNIAKAILDDVALRMKQEPAATALVIGYNDDKEATGPNSDLDRRRAQAVKDYLVSRHGIDPSRITVEGHDGQESAGDNTTAAGRLKNRRVVVRLILP
ncbi:MAG: OmpA family protein [Acidobacteriota bacterium]